MFKPIPPKLPPHIEHSVHAIAEVHLEHHRKATPVQRVVDRMTRFVGQPRFVGLMTVGFTAWIALNSVLHVLAKQPLDSVPFPWLETFATLLALYISVLILITQRRENELAEHRERLTLELSIMAEKKSAKIISLLEELRKDHPGIVNREDSEATEMSTAADPQAVLKAINEASEHAADT